MWNIVKEVPLGDYHIKIYRHEDGWYVFEWAYDYCIELSEYKYKSKAAATRAAKNFIRRLVRHDQVQTLLDAIAEIREERRGSARRSR